MKNFRGFVTPLALLGLLAVQGAQAQQNYANDIRHAGKSARIPTLPTEPGKMETYFVNIKDGDVVRSPFRVIFGLIGLGVAPAEIAKPRTGHHHLLIDTPLPLDLTKPIPFSDKYRHYGGGQTETVLELPPGKHTLQLVFADKDHRPLFKLENGSEVVVHSRKITITVEDNSDSEKKN